MACMQLGRSADAVHHYGRAAATLQLRRANLRRAVLDRQRDELDEEIQSLQRHAESRGGPSPSPSPPA